MSKVEDAKPTYSTDTKVFIDRFGTVGDKYATFRPTYPPQLFEIIDQTTKDTPQELALDIGCGSGQVTIDLAKIFKKVVGFDPSESQLTNAKKAENVEYKQSPAETIDFPSNTADLITVGQAAHWFNLPKFYEEVRRLLKPNGYLMMWCYGTASLLNEDAHIVHLDFYDNILGDEYWAPNRRFIDRRYVDIVPPFVNTSRVSFSFKKTLSIVNMIGYYSTWSGYQKYLQTNPEYLSTLKQRLMDAYKTKDETFEIEIEFPVDIIISKME